MAAKRIIIEGNDVHSVGYRPFLLAKARRLGIRNFEVDNVEEEGKTQKVIVSVSGNEKQVREFADFVKNNRPRKAVISKIREAEPPKKVMPIDEFDKTLAAEQQDTMVRTGLAMIGRQDQMLGKQDQMLGKQDMTLGEIISMRKDLSGKQGLTIAEIKNMRNDMNRNFDTLNKKYGTLSERMASIDNTMKELGQAILALAGKKS